MNDPINPQPDAEYILNLYVIGMSPGSLKAIENLKSICEKYLKGKYSLEIVDILKYPETMFENDLVASPTLIKRAPSPVKKLIGDLSNREKVLKLLSITSQDS
jgi:circadian clock protein KaiB